MVKRESSFAEIRKNRKFPIFKFPFKQLHVTPYAVIYMQEIKA